MKKVSKHIAVYLIQKESLFSILNRISINAIILLFPLVHILEDYLLYFLYKWLFVIILVYHMAYGINKLLASDWGISALFILIYLTGSYLESFQDGDASQYFYYFLLFHVIYGVGSVFTDYLLSDLRELFFFDFNSF